ncbi:MAG: selenocysteine-specific translation elongation factor [Mogibacterium sp.]|nr:selenocysteine-specific translation elongation factor [Mogibacterium sp.]
MKNIIIGTAGHVDHGKTTLIKALSGIDTDRLIEEKRRGITIELGFAHIPNNAGYNIGVVDVPGHEKFIKHMLAGTGGIDFVLFVVAADEGIMPQTKEHFEILSALGIDDGIIALTKTDMVEDDWLEMLIEDIREYFKGSFLEDKPLIPVSAANGDGIEELRNEIVAKCDRENKRREEKELFRLPVDRVFTMQGFGTVVTGTLMDGSVSLGQEVLINPKGTKAKIMGIQTYGKETETAFAGQRTAINLSGVSKENIDRGDVISYPGAVIVTNMLDVKLGIFSSADRTVLNNSRVHLYTGSDEVLCKVILLDRDSLSSGEEAYAQLRLEEPAAVRRGDRFIIRFYSPIITVGGGRIIDAFPQKHKRNRPEVLELMERLESSSVGDVVYAKSAQPSFVRQDSLAEEMGLLKSEMEAIAQIEIKSGRIIRLSDGSLMSDSKALMLRDKTVQIIEVYHKENPLSDGVPRQELLSRMRTNWHIKDEKLIQALLAYMLEAGIVKDHGKSISLSGFKIEYSEEQLELKGKIAEMYKAAGIELIKNEEIFSLTGDAKTGRAIQEDLCEEGVIVKLSPSYYIESGAWRMAVDAAMSFDSGFTLAEYRDKLQTSRKYAEELLSAMDRQGITRFNGETREAIGRCREN